MVVVQDVYLGFAITMSNYISLSPFSPCGHFIPLKTFGLVSSFSSSMQSSTSSPTDVGVKSGGTLPLITYSLSAPGLSPISSPRKSMEGLGSACLFSPRVLTPLHYELSVGRSPPVASTDHVLLLGSDTNVSL